MENVKTTIKLRIGFEISSLMCLSIFCLFYWREVLILSGVVVSAQVVGGCMVG